LYAFQKQKENGKAIRFDCAYASQTVFKKTTSLAKHFTAFNNSGAEVTDFSSSPKHQYLFWGPTQPPSTGIGDSFPGGKAAGT
jgi:hypothetical protein